MNNSNIEINPWVGLVLPTIYQYFEIILSFLTPIVQWSLTKCDVIVGLRPALEGFVVTMHEGACETGSQIPTA